jgi:hypothetical protein
LSQCWRGRIRQCGRLKRGLAAGWERRAVGRNEFRPCRATGLALARRPLFLLRRCGLLRLQADLVRGNCLILEKNHDRTLPEIAPHSPVQRVPLLRREIAPLGNPAEFSEKQSGWPGRAGLSDRYAVLTTPCSRCIECGPRSFLVEFACDSCPLSSIDNPAVSGLARADVLGTAFVNTASAR